MGQRRTDNPCESEAALSLRCLNDSNGDKSACQDAIENYKICKRFWHQISRNRAWAGIEPEMPLAEERQRIKQSFRQSGKMPTTKQDFEDVNNKS